MNRSQNGPDHWERLYLISEVSVSLISRELGQIEQNTIHTPDTRASFDKIRDTLGQLKGA